MPMETQQRTGPPLRTETPTGLLKTRELTLIVIITQVVGNIALSRGMRNMGSILSLSPWPYLHAVLNPWVAAGVVILAFWMLADLALLSRADLSYVLPVTAVSYVLIAVAGRFVLGERISLTRWSGIAVISMGVMLVGQTPTRTVPDVTEEEGED
jgi:drug/metabolite transporter (DMT)-like permease